MDPASYSSAMGLARQVEQVGYLGRRAQQSRELAEGELKAMAKGVGGVEGRVGKAMQEGQERVEELLREIKEFSSTVA